MDTIEITLDQKEEVRWQAFLRRDVRQDGRFVVGVLSTRIYCRPSCAARRPRRENVRFFDDGLTAQAAGLRPCRRCRPEDAAQDAAWVAKACAILDEEAGEPLTLPELARRIYVSPSHLQRLFVRTLGLTPRQYRDARRRERFAASLKNGATVSEAQYGAGYRSPSRVYGGPGKLGMTPGEYRRDGAGRTIRYALTESPLGRLLVAATDRGVCMVALGESDHDLVIELHSEYPAAEIFPAGDALNEILESVLESVAGKRPRRELPLDVQTTAFRQQVYQALLSIPPGETRTYSQIAAEIDHPRAVRAVGSACAANPAAVVIPCHRVLRNDGNLGGYRWGLVRKQSLLEAERRQGLSTGEGV